MNQHHCSRRFSRCIGLLSLLTRPALVHLVLRVGVRLGLSLVLLSALCVVVAGASLPAHAAPAATLTVTDCSGQTGPGRIGTVLSLASALDTITFSCSGTIPISSTLIISTTLTLDGSGQSVTLDGDGSTRVLFVNSGVTFTLNALTVAHGFASIVDPNGGGLANFGRVNISNSTFANNSASLSVGGKGGGVANAATGTMSISNSTFSGNSAFPGGGLFNDRSTVSISGSIVANNPGGNCFGNFSDQGYNLESGTDCGFTGTGSLQNTDPKLDPNGLHNNGGPTQTLALQASSPAVDHIPAAQCLATDQRGVSRLPGERCDIGAFEFPDTTPPTLSLPGTVTVDATSPQGAVVSYTATATDDDGDALTPTCAPTSGSTFAIGTTTVHCSASEPGSNSSSGSFQVVVKGAAAQVTDLINLVNSFGLPADFQASFDTQLQAVLADLQANNTTQACSDLTAFSNHVQAQSGKGLTVSQANQLLAAAKQIRAVLGC